MSEQLKERWQESGYLETVKKLAKELPDHAMISLTTVVDWHCTPTGTDLRRSFDEFVTELQEFRKAQQRQAIEEAISLFQQDRTDAAVEVLDRVVDADSSFVQRLLQKFHDEAAKMTREVAATTQEAEAEPKPDAPRIRL